MKQQSAPQFESLEQRKHFDAYVFFHEFLYIVCNAQSRVDQITKNHKINLSSELYYLNQWELDRTCYQQEGNAMTHIHLLNADFRDDKRPVKLVSNALNMLADSCRWKFHGAQADKKAKYTDYNIRDLFNNRLQQKIDKCMK